jgi:hypothetical protein
MVSCSNFDFCSQGYVVQGFWSGNRRRRARKVARSAPVHAALRRADPTSWWVKTRVSLPGGGATFPRKKPSVTSNLQAVLSDKKGITGGTVISNLRGATGGDYAPVSRAFALTRRTSS